ncbi:MAG TPA: chloride channel protein [Spirochaetota bacterium]|nr:chloride channel protein [Spirochaetota bacterium]HOM86434.1 chloride channel protein [Spirochaetota bacterium]HPD05433.1 chloride channel protein [Spirochaetota bacterium]HQI38081.1 chloride channel protein [Spirochaetota bacterium]HRR60468.1 chloride channel protein [Spirochaetota bacterium]
MKKLHSLLKKYKCIITTFFTTRYDIREYIVQIGMALCIGAIAGLGAMVFHTLIEWMRIVINPKHFADYLEIPSITIVIIPVIGGLITIGMTKMFPWQAKDRGVKSIIRSVMLQNGHIPIVNTLFHLIASAVTLGTGAPLGPEGPSAKIGGGLGSYISTLLRFNSRKKITYTVAGAGAAISAIFNAPIAGVFFGIEVILLNDLKNESLSALVIASVTSDMISKAYLGNNSLLQIPVFQMDSTEFPYFLLLAIVCGIISLLFMGLSRSIKKLYKKIKGDDVIVLLLPVSLLFAFVVFIYNDLFGIGYELINKVLSNHFPINVLIMLLVLKLLFVALYIQTGAYGGLFAPSLVIGVLVGFLFASFFSYFGVKLDPAGYAIIGMGGILAGLNSIPITAILMVFELTNDYRIILPIMLASVISHLTVTFYNKGTVYELELLEDGLDVSKSRINILESIQVLSILKKDFQTINARTPLNQTLDKLLDSDSGLIVVDDNNEYVGILSINEVRQALLSSNIVELLICRDIVIHVEPLQKTDSAAEALKKMDKHGIDFLAVVEKNKVVGMVQHRDIISIYNKLVMQLEEKAMAM